VPAALEPCLPASALATDSIPASFADGGRRVFLDACCPRPADIAIGVAVGPEFIAGSTRLKAGTAQKLVLNMLTTLAMVRSHKTYGNSMVDVRATNAKLVARAFSLVQDVTGAPPAEVQAALDASDGEVKTAIAVILTGARGRPAGCGLCAWCVA